MIHDSLFIDYRGNVLMSERTRFMIQWKIVGVEVCGEMRNDLVDVDDVVV